MRSVAVLAFAVLLAAVSARVPSVDEIPSYTFDNYMVDFRRNYEGEELEARRQIFEARKKEVVSHNGCPRASRLYKKAINDFSDKTEAELRMMRGGRIHENYKFIQEQKKNPMVGKFESTGAPLPNSVDWRNRVPSIFSAIKNQGSCGSCWAHASVETLESHWALATGQLFALSQQQVTACAPNQNQCGGTGGCGGSIAELAYTYLTTAGIAEEWTYPYTAFNGTTGQCRPSKQIQTTDVKLNGYTSITSNDQHAVMEALARVGPLAINVDASKWNSYGSGIYDGCHYNISIDHVVQLVGYGHDFSLNADYWIVRNSWSPAWGENGYIRLHRNSTPTCGWDVDPQDGTGCAGGPAQLWACGQCGLLFDTVYPNVVSEGVL